MATTRTVIAHLLRRTGFGPTAAEIDAATAAGYTATVEKLLDFGAADPADAVAVPAFAPVQPLAGRGLTLAQRETLRQQRAAELKTVQTWWLQRMITTAHPLREKLALYWHGHFTSSFDKVQRADLLFNQNQLFRSHGAGSFEALAQAVAKDPAMMVWLDTSTDKAVHPNENFARELMELFTLGIGNYSEDDVREAARAFTGWVVNPRTGAWALQARQHDPGPKTVLGVSGDLGGEDVVHIVTTSPVGRAFAVARLWSHFAYPVTPADPVVASLVPGFTADGTIGGLIRSILMHPQFVSTAAQTGLVKQPIEWLIGALRQLGVAADHAQVIPALALLAQIPLRPPNVAGWPQNGYWLSTASSLGRYRIATVLTAATGVAAPIEAAAAADRVDAAAHLLGVTWSASTASALQAVADRPSTLLALALVAPETVLA